MNLQSKLIGACVGVFVLLASPAVQASPSFNAASSAANATNSAVQSAVRAARDDAANKVAAQRQTKTVVKTR